MVAGLRLEPGPPASQSCSPPTTSPEAPQAGEDTRPSPAESGRAGGPGWLPPMPQAPLRGLGVLTGPPLCSCITISASSGVFHRREEAGWVCADTAPQPSRISCPPGRLEAVKNEM